MKEQTAKIFMNGRSQAIRLPKDCRFEGDEVYIQKEGNKVILMPKPSSWKGFFEQKERPSDNFMEDRTQEEPQKRKLF